jgi:hypothetical protein
MDDTPTTGKLNSPEVDLNWAHEIAATNDNHLLEKMRSLIQSYIDLRLTKKIDKSTLHECKNNFEGLRNKLRDPMLKEFSSFNFMEKLYMQELSTE